MELLVNRKIVRSALEEIHLSLWLPNDNYKDEFKRGVLAFRVALDTRETDRRKGYDFTLACKVYNKYVDAYNALNADDKEQFDLFYRWAKQTEQYMISWKYRAITDGTFLGNKRPSTQ